MVLTSVLESLGCAVGEKVEILIRLIKLAREVLKYFKKCEVFTNKYLKNNANMF